MSRCWVRVCGVRRVTPHASQESLAVFVLASFHTVWAFLSVRLFVCQLRRSMILATYGLTNRVSRRGKTNGTGRGRCQHSSARRASRTTTPAGTLMDTLHMTAHFIFLIPTSPLPSTYHSCRRSNLNPSHHLHQPAHSPLSHIGLSPPRLALYCCCNFSSHPGAGHAFFMSHSVSVKGLNRSN